MCTETEFCSAIGVSEGQFIIRQFKPQAAEVVPVDPGNDEMQRIYQELLLEGVLELRRKRTQHAIHLWPIVNEVVLSIPGKTHATLTLKGMSKSITPSVDPEILNEEDI